MADERQDDGIAWMTAAGLRAAFAARTLSPIDVARDLLARIERLNPSLHAFVTVDPDSVLDQARRAEAALFGDEPLGPLHGVPVSIKDTIDTAGLRTTRGSLLFAERVPQADSVVARRLRAAGAIILGKTNTPEFATSGRTSNRVAVETRNPWDTARSPAGSSGGAGAAVAAGLGPIGIGTDAGGSIRWPAAFNGVFGLHPSYGRVPETGCFEGSVFGSPFASIGPLARDVRDAALCLQVLAGHDPSDPMSSRRSVPDYLAACDAGVQGLTIGWAAVPSRSRREPGVEDQIRKACDGFAALGARVTPLDETLPDASGFQWTLQVAASGALRAIAASEERRSLLTPYVAEMVDAPIPTPQEEAAAWAARRDLVRRMDAVFAQIDLIATPAAAFPAPVLPEAAFEMFMPYEQYITVASIANVAGLTSVSIPCGVHEGLPVALMLMAPRGREDLVLRAAAAFERQSPWADRRPPVDHPVMARQGAAA